MTAGPLPDKPLVQASMAKFDQRTIRNKRPAPEFNAELNYVHTGRYRPIRVYHAVDQRFILEDFFAKLAWWYRKEP